jgi:hypothetical protein
LAAGTDLLIAWPNWSVTAMRIEERERGTSAIRTSLPDRSNSGPRNQWVTIQDYYVEHTKKLDNSVISVSVMGTIGFRGTSQTTACLWRLLVDGNTEAVTKYAWTHSSPYYGWFVPQF